MTAPRKILLFADWFAPGYKAGGPIRSCVNFAHHMRDNYQVYVFTSDRDLGSTSAYEGITTDKWYSPDGKVLLYYASPAGLTWKNIRVQLTFVQPDFIYLNSMFSTRFTVFPLLLQRLFPGPGKIFLSPRGMLRSSAVQFKSLKKKIFFNSFRLLGFHRRVTFLASDETEVNDVKGYFGNQTKVALVPNFPAALPDRPIIPEKKAGELSMVYIGRIHPIKNTDFLLRVLKDVTAKVRLTIVGSQEDPAFWAVCERLISELPSNIEVKYAGEIPNHRLPDITIGHHIFTLPTRGENFGHAIFEALVLGKPALISDQTPWRGLNPVKAGWDLPLDRPDLFSRAIEEAAAFSQEEYTEWSMATRKFVENYLLQLDLKDEYLKLFC